MMALSFIPRRHLLARLEAGFTLVPGHEYAPADWAILMASPIEGSVLKPCDIASAFNQFKSGTRRKQPVRRVPA